MATVYRAHDTHTGEVRAVKLLRPEVADRTVTRFVSEADTLARMEHPNIVNIFERGSEGGRHFLVMELMAGSVAARIPPGGMGPRAATRVAIDVLEGLGHAHARGVIHRDIKPENILLSPDGQAKIGDFGVARVAHMRLTQTGTTMGTLAYMAPEQRANAKGVDLRADLYAVGATLCTLLTGAAPSELYWHATHAALLDRLPEGLSGVVRRATARLPGDRYDTAASMIAVLRDALDVLPPDPPPVERAPKKRPAASGVHVLAAPSQPTTVEGPPTLLSSEQSRPHASGEVTVFRLPTVPSTAGEARGSQVTTPNAHSAELPRSTPSAILHPTVPSTEATVSTGEDRPRWVTPLLACLFVASLVLLGWLLS